MLHDPVAPPSYVSGMTPSERGERKSGRLRRGVIWFRPCSQTANVARTYEGAADLFGVQCLETSEVFLVPVQDVPGRGAHLRIQPTANHQVRGIRWASDYLLPPGGPLPAATVERNRSLGGEGRAPRRLVA